MKITPETIKTMARQGRLGDIMDLIPADHPNRAGLLRIANKLVGSYANGEKPLMAIQHNTDNEVIRLGYNPD